jgi:ABC-2 type transport system ATP-binding protein/lipopolysaccharide transport system ATP-binding protein
MSHIVLNDVHVDFPVFTSRSRGLINTVFGYARSDNKRIEASGLYGVNVHALRGITLEFNKGDRVGLIGRNGSGKTTLLRVLSGAYEPTSGDIEVSGTLSSLTDITLGMDLEADGYENIMLRSIVMGRTRREAKERIGEIEEFTGLGEYLRLPVRVYSSGMLLRLAFAVSTAIKPEILLMDEMIGAGDAHFIEKAQARLQNLMSDASILVLASHSSDILRQFCNRGVVLEQGQIVFSGELEACLSYYAASSQ